TQTGAILGQATELLKIPAISGAVTGLFGWLGNAFTKKSAKERLALIEQNQHSEETISNLKINLETVLEDNEELQKELAEKLKEIEIQMEKAGIKNVTKTNTVIVSGTGHITPVDINKSTITINR
ncbi:MAG: hypothetical protein WCP19_14290, partial [Chloroflexota bacterium]